MCSVGCVKDFLIKNEFTLEITFPMQVHTSCASIYIPQRFGLELMRPVADSLVEEAPGIRSFSQSYFNEFQLISHPQFGFHTHPHLIIFCLRCH